MNELPTHHGPCPYCGSAISCVTRDGTTYARCSHRGCGARGPVMRSLDRAVEMFRRGRAIHPEPPDAGHDCDDEDCQRCHHLAPLRAQESREPPDAGRCEECEGSGYVTWADKCEACNGTGRKR